MTPTPDLTQIMRELYGTLAPERVVFVTTTDSSAAAILCLVSLIGLAVLGIVLITVWQNTWGKRT